MRKIYDWDSGKYLGSIPEASTTYDVVGNSNEHMLTIGETTFGGLESLAGNISSLLLMFFVLSPCASTEAGVCGSFLRVYSLVLLKYVHPLGLNKLILCLASPAHVSQNCAHFLFISFNLRVFQLFLTFSTI